MAEKRTINTAIIVDPMGHGCGEYTPQDEIRQHTEHFTEMLERPLKVHAPAGPHGIEAGTELVIFDFGGMLPGTSLMEDFARAIVKWAEEHPSALVIVVSEFTWNRYVEYEMKDRGLTGLPNITHGLDFEEQVPEWWIAGLK